MAIPKSKPKSKLKPRAKDDRFAVQSRFEGQTLHLRFSGLLSEDVIFETLLKQIGTLQGKLTSVNMDLSEINRINSAGVVSWTHFLTNLQKIVPIRFALINEIAIDQASVTPQFLGKSGTPVDEFTAPYFCEGCKTRVSVHFKPADIRLHGSSFAPRPVNCERCSIPMQFDSTPEEYFSFLRHHFPQ